MKKLSYCVACLRRFKTERILCFQQFLLLLRYCETYCKSLFVIDNHGSQILLSSFDKEGKAEILKTIVLILTIFEIIERTSIEVNLLSRESQC